MCLAASKPVVLRICILGILVMYLLCLARMRPARYFGAYHDDTVYFSSAKALAEGRGYIIPSFPGTLAQTKYPVLYPWLLSWIWRWNPSFPANLVSALSMTALFGCWSLIAAFQLLRKLEGVGDWPALVIVGLCAFQAQFLSLSAAVMSDMPSIALALTAAVTADSAMRRDGRMLSAVATGILAGLSAAMRVSGFAVVAGIFATAVYRRAYRQAAVFCMVAVLFLGVVLWLGGPHLFTQQVDNEGATREPGWHQTFIYYTSYWGSWKASVPSLEAFLNLLKVNLLLFLVRPLSYLVAPLVEPTSLPGMTLYAILTVGILIGIVRQAHRQEWKPIHFIFLPYAVILLLWNFPQMWRFLLLYLPLFYAGLFVEGDHMVSLLARSLRSGRPTGEKLLAGALTVGLSTLAGAGAWNYVDGGRQQWLAKAAEREAIAGEKMEAYDWLRENTSPNTRIVAYEDVILYMYTERQAVRPIIAYSIRNAFADDKGILEEDLAHITDTPRHVGARFWLTADDDYSNEGGARLIEQRMAQLKAVLPMAFRSLENKVQVYDLTCVLHPVRAECKSVASVLFPGNQGNLRGDP
jgi:4-amino-4-deoxy-L-arabinose transferase-like glycosyltransferase